jgi:hypothetical protein
MSWSTCHCGNGGAGTPDECAVCGGRRPWARRLVGGTISANDTLSTPPSFTLPEIPLVEPNETRDEGLGTRDKANVGSEEGEPQAVEEPLATKPPTSPKSKRCCASTGPGD